MAGSYNHVDSGWSTIEHIGDAYEAVEEMYYLIACYLEKSHIEAALKQFARLKRGEIVYIEYMRRAYDKTQEVMNK